MHAPARLGSSTSAVRHKRRSTAPSASTPAEPAGRATRLRRPSPCWARSLARFARMSSSSGVPPPTASVSSRHTRVTTAAWTVRERHAPHRQRTSTRSRARDDTRERRRRRASTVTAHRAQRAGLPLRAQQPEDDDVERAVAVAVIAAQHALALEADPLQRALRARVLDVRVRAEALEAEQLEREMAHERLGLAVGAGPPPRAARARCRSSRGGRGARARASPVMPIGPALEVLDDEVELLAALALRRQPREVRARLGLRRVRPPREPARHLRIGRLREQRGGVVVARDPHAQRRAGEGERRPRAGRNTTDMLALLYDVHGNLPALDAVLADAGEQGADAYLIGGDVALFGPWPEETVARLRSSRPRPGSAATASAGPPTRARRPSPSRGADRGRARGARRRARRELDALPESRRSTTRTRAWHGSPVSDVRSFLPEPADDEAELLTGVAERRLVFGHTHLPFARSRRPRRHRARQPRQRRHAVRRRPPRRLRAAARRRHDRAPPRRLRPRRVPVALRANATATRTGSTAPCTASRPRRSKARSRACRRRDRAARRAARLAIALARELLHGSGALRVSVALDARAAGDRRVRAAARDRRARRATACASCPTTPPSDVVLPELPFMRRCRPFEVDAADGRGRRRARRPGDARPRRPRPRGAAAGRERRRRRLRDERPRRAARPRRARGRAARRPARRARVRRSTAEPSYARMTTRLVRAGRSAVGDRRARLPRQAARAGAVVASERASVDLAGRARGANSPPRVGAVQLAQDVEQVQHRRPDLRADVHDARRPSRRPPPAAPARDRRT